MLNKLKKLLYEKREICLYVFFGGLTTAVSFATYFFFRRLFPNEDAAPNFLAWFFRAANVFGVASDTVLPNTLSWIFAVTFAYVTNKTWVFKSRQKSLTGAIREFFSFYGARVFTFLVDLLLMFLLVDLTGLKGGWYEFFAKAAASVAVLTLNYVLSKLVVFRKREK
ncbi:MAG: GtrA family protein [Oscillospiraceae bacterium]|jgi:putative flippase GtrA|nr:GtrA family protein [Oscillospiraceae bacterium]